MDSIPFENMTNKVLECVETFRRGFRAYLDGEDFATLLEKASELESEADNIRRKMSLNLFRDTKILVYSKADKLALVEALDKIADKTELAANLTLYMKPKIPKSLKADFVSLTDLTFESVQHLGEAVRLLATDFKACREAANKAKDTRHLVRKKEFEIIEKMFKQDEERTLTKFEIKDISSMIARIADKAEEVADTVSVLTVKYTD